LRRPGAGAGDAEGHCRSRAVSARAREAAARTVSACFGTPRERGRLVVDHATKVTGKILTPADQRVWGGRNEPKMAD